LRYLPCNLKLTCSLDIKFLEFSYSSEVLTTRAQSKLSLLLVHGVQEDTEHVYLIVGFLRLFRQLYIGSFGRQVRALHVIPLDFFHEFVKKVLGGLVLRPYCTERSANIYLCLDHVAIGQMQGQVFAIVD
jgi:hypothetical protein